MSTVIKIENLYKEYRLGAIGHGTLYRDLQSWWAKLKGKEDPNSLLTGGYSSTGKENSQILALNNINLEIKAGEVLGIIGTNGAGKSTLLKILSRVTAPTKGCIKVKGKIASLLEVGTGFHAELTGRENIYLNGAINGMSNYDISRKLDEIVDFSGVEKFLDTPVKRYSTGMHVRLGFAVAAHLEPDIMVVDEVLAVGDAEFQKKAIGKMQDISKEKGRTVLFVSHNLQSIKSLCSRAILLDNGKNVYDSDSANTVNEYLKKSISGIERSVDLKNKLHSGNQSLRFTEIRFEDDRQNVLAEIVSNETLTMVLEYETTVFIDPLAFLLDLRIKDESGLEIASISTDSSSRQIKFKSFEKKGCIRIKFNNLILMGGLYYIDIYSSIHYGKRISLDNVMNAATMDIQPGNIGSHGIVNLKCDISN